MLFRYLRNMSNVKHTHRMRRMFFYLAVCLLTFVAVSCDKDDDKDDAVVSDKVEEKDDVKSDDDNGKSEVTAKSSVENTYYLISFLAKETESVDGVIYLKDGSVYMNQLKTGDTDTIVLYKVFSYTLTATDETSGSVVLKDGADEMKATYNNLSETGGLISMNGVSIEAKNILTTVYKDVKFVLSDESGVE